MPGYLETERELGALQKTIAAREKKLIPLYHQIALSFVGLHDTPGRMVRKGVIQGVVPWHSSRRFFYWRLRRRQLECHAIQRMLEVDSSLEWDDAQQKLRDACAQALGDSRADETYASDEKFVAWISAAQQPQQQSNSSSASSPSSSPNEKRKGAVATHKRAALRKQQQGAAAAAKSSSSSSGSDFEALIAGLRASRVQRDMSKLFRASPSGALQGLLDVFDTLSPSQTALVKRKLGLSAQ